MRFKCYQNAIRKCKLYPPVQKESLVCIVIWCSFFYLAIKTTEIHVSWSKERDDVEKKRGDEGGQISQHTWTCDVKIIPFPPKCYHH
jgi:hypothetical protein